MAGIRAAGDRDHRRGVAARVAVPVDDAAHAVVALYLGLEMLSHLDGDREPALRLFDRAGQLATLFVVGDTNEERNDDHRTLGSTGQSTS